MYIAPFICKNPKMPCGVFWDHLIYERNIVVSAVQSGNPFIHIIFHSLGILGEKARVNMCYSFRPSRTYITYALVSYVQPADTKDKLD